MNYWKKIKKNLKLLWWFIWKDDSLASWIVNVILAFILVKFVIYPGLGLLLGTPLPVVAVVSGSMEHNGMGFNEWWENNYQWYEDNGISKEEMKNFPMSNGFNKGDIIILYGTKIENLQQGDIIVYSTERYKYPIIHRVVKTWSKNSYYEFKTKGDNNYDSDPEVVKSEQILGEAKIKIPWLGWIKILFTKIIGG